MSAETCLAEISEKELLKARQYEPALGTVTSMRAFLARPLE